MSATDTALSLRTRVVLGAVLWTLGLFGLAGVAVTQLMRTFPQAPALFHAPFVHVVPVSIAVVACMAAGILQVRSGLAGMDRLRRRLAAVRDGNDQRVTGSYPAEVQPLVDDLNALLAQREATVERAIARAGDLAHGLKTPLAVLAHEADRAAASGQPETAAAVGEQVERMKRQIDYHLAHARAAASGALAGARANVRESADGLARTLDRLHAERGIAIAVAVAPSHVARCRLEDLDEMLGNLLDNACTSARTRVAVSSATKASSLVVTVEDDGPGLAPELCGTVLQRGAKADEAGPGSGLGLAIVRDLVELYGGSIALDPSPLGGLRVAITLPSA